MALDPKILRAVLNEFEAYRFEAEHIQTSRREEVFSAIPRVKKIDIAMKSALSRILRGVFATGEDPAFALNVVHAENASLLRERETLLLSHGYPANYLDLPVRCKKCGDAGYIGSKPCDCLIAACSKAQTEELSFLLAGADKSFEDFSFEYYSGTPDISFDISPRDQIERIFDAAVEYAYSFGKHHASLFFYGACGIGKTFLSGCIAKEVSARGFSVVYDTTANILSNLEREKFGHADDEALLQIKRYAICDLLILDDLGTEMTSSFYSAALFNLINTRLIARKCMIVNSNLSPADLISRYSPQLASRIEGEFSDYFFFGEDIRKIKKRRKEENIDIF